MSAKPVPILVRCVPCSMRKCLLWMWVLLLSGCASTSSEKKPYRDAWYLGFSAPPYMEAWVETADVEDVRGQILPRAGSGTVSIGYSGEPSEWQAPLTMGAGKHVIGMDLPKRIYVRWQSLVEPQTYRVIFEIPESVNSLMRTKVKSRVIAGKWDYRDVVVIGLFPGGMAKMIVRSVGGSPIEVLCMYAEVEPKGPYRGLSEGKHRPLSERATAYIQHHPIPYDSWK